MKTNRRQPSSVSINLHKTERSCKLRAQVPQPNSGHSVILKGKDVLTARSLTIPYFIHILRWFMYMYSAANGNKISESY